MEQSFFQVSSSTYVRKYTNLVELCSMVRELRLSGGMKWSCLEDEGTFAIFWISEFLPQEGVGLVWTGYAFARGRLLFRERSLIASKLFIQRYGSRITPDEAVSNPVRYENNFANCFWCSDVKNVDAAGIPFIWGWMRVLCPGNVPQCSLYNFDKCGPNFKIMSHANLAINLYT